MGEMNEQSDVQLLCDYAEGGNETAFRELVARHTDLVYSAALRQVRSPQLAGMLPEKIALADLPNIFASFGSCVGPMTINAMIRMMIRVLSRFMNVPFAEVRYQARAGHALVPGGQGGL